MNRLTAFDFVFYQKSIRQMLNIFLFKNRVKTIILTVIVLLLQGLESHIFLYLISLLLSCNDQLCRYTKNTSFIY